MKNKVMVQRVFIAFTFALGFWSSVGDHITRFLEWTYNATGGVGII